MWPDCFLGAGHYCLQYKLLHLFGGTLILQAIMPITASHVIIFHRLFRISLVQIKYLKGVKSLNAIMHVRSRKRMHLQKSRKENLNLLSSMG